MNLKEKPIKRNQIFDGKVFKVYCEKVVLPDGNKADREIVAHNGGVCVIPVEGKYVYLVKQYRRGVDSICLEFPAGKLESGEKHYDAGLRELKEEIGACASIYEYIGEIYPTPAYCSEIIHMYIADGLTLGEQNTDADEFLNVERVEIDTLFQMVQAGEISDAKTLIGAYKLKDYINKKNNN